MKIISKLFTLLAVSLAGSNAVAANLTDHPGYLNLDDLPILEGQRPNVEVTLNGAVLELLSALPAQYSHGNEEAAELLKVIDQILVRIYHTPESATGDVLGFIDETASSLESQNWVRIVRVRDEDDSHVDIHVKLSDDEENLSGLVVMAIENKNDEAEVVFVNIAGNFNPAYLSGLGNQFDIDYLDEVEVP